MNETSNSKAAEMKERVLNTCRVIAGKQVMKPHIQGEGPVCVFISGLLGTGEYSSFEHILPYWGLFQGDLLQRLEEDIGIECHGASLGPLSSAWDRACELYAQLTGGRVDYGAAHSKAFGHARFGRAYKPLFEGWSEERPAHLLGHSFGGVTIRLFAQLCAEGAPEEQDATPEAELSPLFKGGLLGRLLSLTTLSTPHNGTTAIVGIQKGQPLWPVAPAFAFLNIVGTLPVLNGIYDVHLEHFGLSNPAGQYRGNTPSRKKLKTFLDSRDHATADVSLDNAREINLATPVRPELYNFSYACSLGAKELPHGKKLIPLKELKNPLLGFFAVQMGMGTGYARREMRQADRSEDKISALVEYDPLWTASDGAVPVASGLCPFGQPRKDFGEKPAPGVWHVMPVKEGVDHGYYCGWDVNNQDFEALVRFYAGHIRLLQETCGTRNTLLKQADPVCIS